MILNGGFQQAQQADVVASLSSEDISKLEKYTFCMIQKLTQQKEK